MEKTLVLIKPDAVKAGHVGDIIKRYEDAGITIIAAKVLRMNDKIAQIHYVEHIDRPYYKELLEFMTSAPIMALVLAGENVIKRVRDINGVTDPKKAADGSIRKLYGTDITRNAVHASDGYESAEWEIPIYFNEIEMFEG